jgi:hypothetical protein
MESVLAGESGDISRQLRWVAAALLVFPLSGPLVVTEAISVLSWILNFVILFFAFILFGPFCINQLCIW